MTTISHNKHQIIIGLLLLLCAQLSAQQITVNFPSIRIDNLLDSIEVKAGIHISYDARAVPGDSIVSVAYNNIHPVELVRKTLQNAPVRVQAYQNQIVISKYRVANVKDAVLRLGATVLDANDSTALPMVNIAIKGAAMGTTTNNDGQFDFVLPPGSETDTIICSFLGYRLTELPVASFLSNDTIWMQRHGFELPEVEVRVVTPLLVLSTAQTKRNDNYWQQEALLTGFFRESIKQDTNFVQVSEAIIEIIKPSYSNDFNFERVRFVKGRKQTGLKDMEQINFKLEGGPFQFSRIDIMRYFDFFPKDEKGYTYAFEGSDYLNDELVYKIGFKPLDDNGELYYQGVLFIHSQSYALVRATFELTKRSLRYSRRLLIKKTSGKIKVRPQKASYFMDYRPVNDRWILSRVGGVLEVHVVDKEREINSVFTGISELLVSDCHPVHNERFKWSEVFKASYILADEITETDDEFWEDYNIIKPEEDLEKVFKEKAPSRE